jgi:hypothetical protein
MSDRRGCQARDDEASQLPAVLLRPPYRGAEQDSAQGARSGLTFGAGSTDAIVTAALTMVGVIAVQLVFDRRRR